MSKEQGQGRASNASAGGGVDGTHGGPQKISSQKGLEMRPSPESEACRDLGGMDGREAAFEDLGDYELCLDLAGRYARESTHKSGEGISLVRDRLEAIALGFLCVRGAGSSEALLASSNALRAFREEFERDPQGLLRFLRAVFKRWRTIEEPGSVWRVKTVTQQHGSRDHKAIADYVETIGAEKHTGSLRSRVRQYLSRDQRKAIARRALSALRAAGDRGMSESEICCSARVSIDALPEALRLLQRSGRAKCRKDSTGSVEIKRWFAL